MRGSGSRPRTLVCLAVAAALAVVAGAAAADTGLAYDIVYVRQPRSGDAVNTTWPEVAHPARIEPGADLMLLHPDGSEEVLVPGGSGAVTDPFVSFDGRAVYYSYFHDVRPEAINSQRGLSRAGADIYRIDLATRQVRRLTFGEFTPNTGSGRWDESNPVSPPAGWNALGYGIFNLGPAPVAGGKVAFVSNRNGFVPPAFDLALVATMPGLAIRDGRATLDGVDVTAALAGCLLPGALPAGGVTYRCPALSFGVVGPGLRTLRVEVTLDDGTSTAAVATWEVLATRTP
jgi:hypothetical protein